MGFRIFGRDPAWVLAVIAAGVSAFSAFILNVTMDQQAAINAVAAACVGLGTAWWVARDKLLPAVVGVAQAVLLLAVTYGFDVPPEKQAILLTLVGLVAAGFVRTQVTASVPPSGHMAIAR